jgi:hypothetical protein
LPPSLFFGGYQREFDFIMLRRMPVPHLSHCSPANLKRISCCLFLIAVAGCGGGSGSNSLPAASIQARSKADAAVIGRAAASTAPVLIDAGGPAIGAWSADTHYNGGWIPLATTHAIDTSHVTSPAPQAVYQTSRVGNMSYAVTGFTPAAAYTVRLHFVEPYWPGPGMRSFNVAVNGQAVLTKFDIFKDSGGEFIADIKSFAATADANGTITIRYATVVDNALAAGIEVEPAAAATLAAGASLLIDSGGAAIGAWQADTDFRAGWVPLATAHPIDTSHVTSAAPSSVYQSNRVGNFSYVLPGLTPAAAYTVRLHFAETYWPGPGMRLFNVAINGSPVLTNFDIFKDSGGEFIADIKSFAATASASGTVTITFAALVDNALIAGVELDSSGFPSTTSKAAPASAPTPVWTGSTEAPRAADTFVDSVGVNTHLCTPGSLYDGSYTTVSGLLKKLGIRHIRDTMTFNAWQPYYTRLSQLASYGIHGDMVTNINEPISQLAAFVAAAPGVVELVEAPAEYDRSKDANWAADLASYQRTLYAGVKNTPSLASLGVLGPALASFNYSVIGNISGSVDYGNLHDYFGNTNPGQTGTGYGSIPYWIVNEQPLSGSKPIITTETGYQDVASQPDAVTPAVKVRYSMRTLLEQFNARIVRTYFYEFLDELGQNYGFIDSTLAPKPAYTALAIMLNDLNDPGPISLTPLSYALTADPSVHHTLLQKRDGTYRLFLWVDVTAQDSSVPTQSVTLTFPSNLASISQTAWRDDGTVATTNLTQSNNAVTFTISDRVSEIKLQR